MQEAIPQQKISQSSPIVNLIDGDTPNIPNILFSEIITGKPQSFDANVIRQRTSMKIAIGNLLVRGYFIYKKMKNQQCIIFAKRKNFETHYIYFKILERYQEQLPNMFFTQLNLCIKQINHLKRKQSHNFSLQICFLYQKQSLQILNGAKLLQVVSLHKKQLTSTKKLLSFLNLSEHYIINSYIPIIKFRQIQQDSQQQFQKLKDIIYHYIDTFAQKYKTNYYADLERQCMTSYRIGYLINTINHMIYEETKGKNNTGQLSPMYNQIQSSCWTIFLAKKQQLHSDRKDIMFSGNGRILLVDMLFMKKIEQHVNQAYKKEVKLYMEDCQLSYIQGKLKVMWISNQLNQSEGYGLIYKYHMKTIDGYSKIDSEL